MKESDLSDLFSFDDLDGLLKLEEYLTDLFCVDNTPYNILPTDWFLR